MVLAGLAYAGEATPAVLLLLTFGMGAGQALTSPAWQAIQPGLVSREQIPAAAALGSVNINVSRAVGPALAGAVLAVGEPWVVFAINAASFAALLVALLRWHPDTARTSRPEQIGPALLTGIRYVRNAPGVRRILLRSALFVLPAGALWSLLAVVSADRLHLGSGGYGLLLAALGSGAVVGAALLSTLRARLSTGRLLAAASVIFAAGTLAAGLLSSAAAVAVLLFAAGIAWLVMLSTLNGALQLTLPAWVRARGLAFYQVVFLGGQGVAAVVWGLVAGPAGVPATLVTATVLILAGTVSLRWWPFLPETGRLDRTIVALPGPHTDGEPDPASGPVLVEVAYTVSDPAAFLAAVNALGRSRRRTGATSWAVYEDAADHTAYTEVFTVPTWEEHLRQHRERVTGYDRELQDRVRATVDTDPVIRHLLPPP